MKGLFWVSTLEGTHFMSWAEAEWESGQVTNAIQTVRKFPFMNPNFTTLVMYDSFATLLYRTVIKALWHGVACVCMTENDLAIFATDIAFFRIFAIFHMRNSLFWCL